MSLIDRAVSGQERNGVERLRETGRLGYRAVTHQAEGVDTSLGQAFQNFGAQSARLYGAHQQKQKLLEDERKKLADERSNEILRKLTPEQRREAFANGTLLYQDDPYAMEALRFKSGRNAAFEVETEIKNKVAMGEFKNADDLKEWRKTRLEDKARAYAEAVGISHADMDYQRGFNADIVQRDAAIYDFHAQKLSEQTLAIAQMETTSDLGSLFADEGWLRSPDSPAQFAAYFNQGLATGAIPTEGMAVASIQKAFADNAAQPGADAFMQSIGEQEVQLYGRTMKVRDIVGPEVLENYQVKAGEAAFKRNRLLTQEFTFGLQNATAQPDPHEGLALLSQMQAALYRQQPSDMVTSQSSQLDAARGRLLAQIAADSAKRQEDMHKQGLSDNRLQMFEAKFQQRFSGDNVSLDWRTFETDESTGKFTKEDAANFAAKRLSEIDRMGLPQEAKDKLKMQYLAVDPEDGPFRAHFETLTTDAMNQFNGLVIAQEAEVSEETTGRIREFQRIYQANPALIGGLYGPQSALARRLSLMERSGIDMSVMIDAERKAKGLTEEERKAQDQKWANLFNGTDSTVAYLPANLRDAARTLFDSELFRTGDETAAKSSVNAWLGETSVQFTHERDGASATHGAVSKRSLMADPQDPTSWKHGQALLERTISDLQKVKPWLKAGDITISDTPHGLRLQDDVGSVNILVTPRMLQQTWQVEQQAKAHFAAKERAEKGQQAIDRYKAEQGRRKSTYLNKENPSRFETDPSAATFEAILGFGEKP